MRPNLNLAVAGEHGDHSTKPGDASTKSKAPTLTIFNGKVAEPIDDITPLATTNVEGVSRMSNHHRRGIRSKMSAIAGGDWGYRTEDASMHGSRAWEYSLKRLNCRL